MGVEAGPASARMAHQAVRDTGPELALRHALFSLGLRYRVDYALPDLPRRSADIVFPRQHVAVFVDGCFWHRCPEHATFPKTNPVWWTQKLQRNWDRDRETDRVLSDGGWTVVRVWEHENTSSSVAAVLEALAKAGH